MTKRIRNLVKFERLAVDFTESGRSRAIVKIVLDSEYTNKQNMVEKGVQEGESWTDEPALLYAHPFGGSQDPCLLKLKDDSILCTSYGWAFVDSEGIENLRSPHFKNARGSVFLGGYYLKSTDGGETWIGPRYPPNISPEVKYSALGDPLPAYNRGALWEGESGRLFWVVAAGDDPDNIGKTSTHLLISDNKGETWQYSCPVAEDDEASFNEASVYETPKGDLVAYYFNIDNDTRHIAGTILELKG